jgi:hypothetical protein
MTGTYQRYLDFYDDHVVIDDVPNLNLGTYSNFIKPQEKPFKPAISALFEIGFQFYLGTHLTFNTKLTGAYGLTNIQNVKETPINFESYNGVAASDKVNVKNLFVGLELGVSFCLWD